MWHLTQKGPQSAKQFKTVKLSYPVSGHKHLLKPTTPLPLFINSANVIFSSTFLLRKVTMLVESFSFLILLYSY